MNHSRISDRRTQIYLPEELYQWVRINAKKQGISIAQVIREALMSRVMPEKQSKNKDGYKSQLTKLCGSLSGMKGYNSTDDRAFKDQIFREK